jgi:hypothetical protein
MDCFAEPLIERRFAPARWLAMTNYASSAQLVVAGHDPAIHLLWRLMDARIKSGHDEVWLARHLNP